MKEIQISPIGNFLIYNKAYTPKQVEKIIKDKNFNGLRIFAQLQADRIDGFDFLNEYNFLEGLEIASRDDYDYNFLKSLTKLKHLNLQNQGTSQIDLSFQNNLEVLSLQWRNNIVGIENCKKLKRLCLVDFKANNLEFVKDLISLEELKIATSTIKNLDGITNCVLLKLLILGNCKSLNSIKSINHLSMLKELEIDRCQKIQDYNLLTDLPNLECLQLTDCKDIQSIQFIRNFPKLKKLVMLGNTNVLDTDIKPARDIEEVIYSHRNHYNIKIENKKNDELIKQNLEKIKNSFK